MKLNDLKIGNVVVLRDDTIYVIKEHIRFGMSLYAFDVSKHDFKYDCSIECFEENMKHCNESKYDIMEVYKDMTVYFDYKCKPIWIRDDLNDLKKGDLVWVSDDDGNHKRWYLKAFVGKNQNSEKFKYMVCDIKENQNFQNSYSYKYAKIARPEDLQWFTEK